MSHYLLVVIKEESETSEDIDEKLDKYSEHRDVEEYTRPCWCSTKANLPKEPDPECSDCNGSGEYLTNYNPDSKWDWYLVGGRWNGVVGNVEVDTPDTFGIALEDEENNTTTTENLLERVRYDEFSGFAYLLPDGEWVERGKMGWFAVVRNESDVDAWKQSQINILEKYQKGYLAVGYDCHI
jgi:hypothetical protein